MGATSQWKRQQIRVPVTRWGHCPPSRADLERRRGPGIGDATQAARLLATAATGRGRYGMQRHTRIKHEPLPPFALPKRQMGPSHGPAEHALTRGTAGHWAAGMACLCPSPGTWGPDQSHGNIAGAYCTGGASGCPVHGIRSSYLSTGANTCWRVCSRCGAKTNFPRRRRNWRGSVREGARPDPEPTAAIWRG